MVGDLRSAAVELRERFACVLVRGRGEQGRVEPVRLEEARMRVTGRVDCQLRLAFGPGDGSGNGGPTDE